jgi:hypothetical protein
VSGVLTTCGIVSIGAAVPALEELMALLATAQNAAKFQINAKLTGLANVSVALTVPPPPSVVAEAAVKTALQLSLNPQIAAPSLQVSANAKIAGELTALLGGLVLPPLDLGAFGIAAYKYTGTIDALGPSVTAATAAGLPGGTGQDVGYAVLLVATTPAAIDALKAVVI